MKFYISSLGEKCSPIEQPVALALTPDKAFELLKQVYPFNWQPSGHNEWADSGASLAVIKEFDIPDSEIIAAISLPSQVRALLQASQP
jgi:hypothetical protein